MNQATKIRKGVNRQTISVGVEARAEACGETPGNKFYRIPLPSTYKETEILDNLNNGV